MRVTRRIEIDAGHRLQNHDGKCRNLHGHRYAFEVTFAGPVEGGMVMDFGDMKAVIASVIDPWDHALHLDRTDPFYPLLDNRKLALVLWDGPPTIEHMVKVAYHLLSNELTRVLGEGCDVHVESVRGYETPNCFADYSGGEL